jgi:hypothetical protein
LVLSYFLDRFWAGVQTWAVLTAHRISLVPAPLNLRTTFSPRIGEPGIDKDRVIGKYSEVDVSPGSATCRVPVASMKCRQSRSGWLCFVAGELAGKQPVEVAGDHGQGGADVDVQRQPGGQRVEVKTRRCRCRVRSPTSIRWA